MKSQKAVLQNELVEAEFVSVSSVAVSALVVLQIIQALFAEPHIHAWQVFYVLGLVLTYLFSLAIRKYLDVEVYLYPVYIFLIAAPVLIGDHASRPWMSLGLITITANIYFCAFEPWIYGLISMVAFTLFQEWALFQNLPSISDLPDMRLLGSYFSFTWTLGIGLAGIVIRKNYVRALETLDGEIQDETLNIIGKLQRISKINRGDYRNLKLHSTTLNTLIHYRNNSLIRKNSKELLRDLDREISELKNLSGTTSLSIRKAINQIISNRVSQRVEIKRISISGKFENPQLQDNFLEIIRELLLNLEKHTRANRASINVKIIRGNTFTLKIKENSPASLASFEFQRLIGNANSSQSLTRLIEIVNGKLNVRLIGNSAEIEHEISGGFTDLEINSAKSMFDMRIRGIDDFAMNFARTAYFFGLLYIPGYFLLHLQFSAFILLTFHALIANLISFKLKESKILLAILTLTSLLIFPILSHSVSTCQDVRYFPWLYNPVLANCFIVAFTVRGKVVRWLPLTALTTESILLPRSFPAGCQNIFLGSLPAIPIIAAFAIALIFFKRRVVREDLRGISTVFEDKSALLQIESSLETEFLKVLKSLEDFRDYVNSGTKGDADLDAAISLEIQRIRSFLFASEQFESKFIREVYAFVVSKYEKRQIVCLLISGKNFFQFDDEIDVKSEIAKWDGVLGTRPAEINIVRSDRLLVNFGLSGLTPTKVKLLTNQLNQGTARIQYSISPQK